MILRRTSLAAPPGLVAAAPAAQAADASYVTVASWASTELSGLRPHLPPASTKATGIETWRDGG